MKMLLNRLESDKELFCKYDHVIQQQENMGIIEEVLDVSKAGTRKYYLPYHPILTPHKETTKIRIVYDASAKARGASRNLNQYLHRGAVILPNLCGLLIRFRMYLLVIMADVEKAFLQIGIQEKERDVTRFLWLRDVNSGMNSCNVIVYRFCRVLFGLVCSWELRQVLFTKGEHSSCTEHFEEYVC